MHVKKSDIESQVIQIPPLPEQRKIADILSTWDRAIEVSEALLSTARTQKRALMQSLLTGKRRFPEFEGQAWKEVRLGDVTGVITKGTTPTSIGFSFTDTGVQFVKAENIDLTGTVSFGSSFISDECHESLMRSQLHEGDILVTIAGAIGRIGRVSKSILPANTNQAVALVRLPVVAPVLRNYIFFWLQSTFIQRIFDAQKTTGAQPNISLSQLSQLPIKYPSLAEQGRIIELLEGQTSRVSAIAENIEKLRTEKKALMQQLLTGKRRVVVDA